MSVIQLHQPKPADGVVRTLRRIADEIENGDPDWPITTAIVVLAGVGAEGRPGDDNIAWTGYDVAVYGMGPRTDPFTVRGVLHAAFDQI